MNVAKVLLWVVLALPVLELLAFGAVAATIGFGWALILLLAGSFAGALVLRHAGGNHIARMRVAMAEGSISSLAADTTGGLVILAGILLLVPGFITDVVALGVLLSTLFRARRDPPPRADGVVDLDPEQWHRVPEPALRDDRDPGRRPG
ncbi:FxsA family protein [Pseudolabrys taiwanensis]|uniref:FxsA family protein n=1 Tax=Pseudolabrys taiwanensis TaxID=331696 RepID=A0A345ZZQ8_9HYPH|nr:FxsA family protein [Pseudolabrys taiwanensis]AXK82405.1 FxsA family protein [Pseudolabrys taiwanensis]